MADILVVGGAVVDGKLTSLKVELQGLPPRTLDRETVMAWMREGHAMTPRINGERGQALLLLEVDDALYIRSSGTPEAADLLPGGMG